jgi:hypothetical protein
LERIDFPNCSKRNTRTNIPLSRSAPMPETSEPRRQHSAVAAMMAGPAKRP